MRLRKIIAVVGAGATLVSGPVYAAPREDPFEATNRGFYYGQSGVDRALFLPLAKLYHFLTPGLIGVAIHNVITNLNEPVVIANDILQARLKQAGRDTLRLTANSTAGLLGVIDVAKRAGLPHTDNDFGVTLGRWGIGPGPYLYLPILGPSTVRDAIGQGVDTFFNPLLYIRFTGRTTLLVSSTIVGGLDTRERAQAGLDAILSDADDPYATLRSVYLQNREALIRGDETPAVLPPLEDEPSGSAPDQSAPPADPSAPPSSDQTPPPGPSAAAASAVRLALANAAVPEEDAPIATARDYDGGHTALAQNGV